MRKLDRIDRMILEILQNEGRIAISEPGCPSQFIHHALLRTCKTPRT